MLSTYDRRSHVRRRLDRAHLGTRRGRFRGGLHGLALLALAGWLVVAVAGCQAIHGQVSDTAPPGLKPAGDTLAPAFQSKTGTLSSPPASNGSSFSARRPILRNQSPDALPSGDVRPAPRPGSSIQAIPDFEFQSGTPNSYQPYHPPAGQNAPYATNPNASGRPSGRPGAPVVAAPGYPTQNGAVRSAPNPRVAAPGPGVPNNYQAPNGYLGNQPTVRPWPPTNQTAPGLGAGSGRPVVRQTAQPGTLQPPFGAGDVPGELVAPGETFEPAFEDPRVNLNTVVSEAPTGRLMFGVGINSDAGLVGSIVLDEQNFDWKRYPRSWSDIRNATAWRGGGQQLRLEAIPGDQVQRYLFSFREPYFLDTRISLGLSGFYFDRRYEDWDEQRLGGRVSLGYQLRHDLTTTVALRAENVNIHDPAVPTPPSLAAVIGDNSIYSGRFTVAHDVRDSAFLPTEGHLIQLSYEQAFGEFDYPRGEIDYRRYFLLTQRLDGTGRHVLSFRGRAGLTGSDTPIFERFYAGGFSTLRGFDFRGASPRVGNVEVGGQLLLIGSVEYLLPVTPDDMIRAVAFCDFGTVERNVSINEDNFRVAPGFGLRVTIPAMGPAPLAFDFAFPVVKAAGDDTQIFSFSVGFNN